MSLTRKHERRAAFKQATYRQLQPKAQVINETQNTEQQQHAPEGARRQAAYCCRASCSSTSVPSSPLSASRSGLSCRSLKSLGLAMSYMKALKWPCGVSGRTSCQMPARLW